MDWYQTAYTHALWVDFSQRGRIVATDRDRLDLMNRISTNKLSDLAQGQGAATLFLTANARILDQVVVLNQGEQALIVTEQGRKDAFLDFLQRNIFWNDRLQLQDISADTQHIALIGVEAESRVAAWWPMPLPTTRYHFSEHSDYTGLLLIRGEDLAQAPSYWLIGNPTVMATVVAWLKQQNILQADLAAYDALRIEAGLPATAHELTQDYLPLEVGLWDAISFNKGCYTGQEIIARMDSRGKLAKMMVRIVADGPLTVGDNILNAEGKIVGHLTSVAVLASDTTPVIGLAIIKASDATISQTLQTNTGIALRILGLAGVYETDYQ